MKPRTLRERRLVQRALLLLEADVLAGETLPPATHEDEEQGDWATGNKGTVSNADIGTISELVSIWYCKLNLERIFDNATVLSKTIGKDAEDKSVAVDINGLITRLQKYCAKYKLDKFKDVYDQGLTQGRSMMKTVQDVVEIYNGDKEDSDWLKDEEIELIKKKKIKKISVVGLGESAALVGATIIGQEDCQIIFEYVGKGKEPTVMLYSNKAGGSSPAQLNKTPVSVGLITKDDLAQKLKGKIAEIKKKSIDMYNDLNKDVPIPKDTIAGAAAIKKKISPKDFWFQMLITNLALSGNSEYTGTESKPNKGVDRCFDISKKGDTFPKVETKGAKKNKKQDPADYGSGGWNCIRPSRSAKFGNTSLSSCCTAVMGGLAGKILEQALEDELKDPALLFDLIMGVGKKSSIWSTMYPSGKLPPITGTKAKPVMPTRKAVAQAALAAITGQKGRYFAVTGKKDTATSMQDVHGGFLLMLKAVADPEEETIKASRFGLSISDDVNGITFTFDGKSLLTVTMRKDTSGRPKYSKASIMLSQTEKAKTDAKQMTDEDVESDGGADGTGTFPVGEKGATVVVQKATGEEGTPKDVKPLKGDDLDTTVQSKPKTPDLKNAVAGVDLEAELAKLKFSSSSADVDWTSISDILNSADVRILGTSGKGKGRKIGAATLSRMEDPEKIKMCIAAINGQEEVEIQITPSAGGAPVTQKIKIPAGTQEKMKQVVSKLGGDKSIQDSYDRSLNSRLQKIIRETVATLLEEIDPADIIGDLSSEELDQVLIALELEEEVIEEGSYNVSEMWNDAVNESRWLKLAGLLKD